MEYTKGEWTVRSGFKVTANEEQMYIADCYPFHEKQPRPTIIQAEANAHLIAAAPELYEAGKKLVKWLHMLADRAEEKARTTRFVTMKEAWEADTKNYRATAREMEEIIAKVRSK